MKGPRVYVWIPLQLSPLLVQDTVLTVVVLVVDPQAVFMSHPKLIWNACLVDNVLLIFRILMHQHGTLGRLGWQITHWIECEHSELARGISHHVIIVELQS